MMAARVRRRMEVEAVVAALLVDAEDKRRALRRPPARGGAASQGAASRALKSTMRVGGESRAGGGGKVAARGTFSSAQLELSSPDKSTGGSTRGLSTALQPQANVALLTAALSSSSSLSTVSGAREGPGRHRPYMTGAAGRLLPYARTVVLTGDPARRGA